MNFLGARLAKRLLFDVAGPLGVNNPRNLKEWIWHLFVLPLPEQQPVPLVDPLVRWIIMTTAAAIGVTELTNRHQWLHCLVFLPPQPPLWIVRQLQHQQATIRHLAHRYVDIERIGNQMDQLSAALPLSLPWRMLIALSCLPVLFFCITTPMVWYMQALFGLVTWSTALMLGAIPGQIARLFLIALSLITTLRYLWWRISSTLSTTYTLDWLFSLILLAAEFYAVLIMLMGYFQTAWPLQRKPVPLPKNPATWPSVDVFIPTYNEPLRVLKPTVLAALGIDWPRDRIHIHVLDDGRREEIRQFANYAQVHYVTRSENTHAKAGNLNHTLKHSSADFIAIFDCDHIPTRSFLQLTMGWFLKDPRCAMIQTPHYFFSPDPFERNLGTTQRIPTEGSLFYDLIQDGNDFWNAAFFCGSCAILRRSHLLSIGGIAVETVTEDAHTALRLHRHGFTTAYLNVPQAAGLATENLASHIGQRIRWARGMTQIFRIDNPLLGKGLNLAQRICYTNAMMHFMFGIPRLVFLLAPMAYLFFQLHLIAASAVSIVSYVVPQLLHSALSNSRTQGQYRHSFWAEVYESVLAWYVALPTTAALISPNRGKFNVTAKGGRIEKDYFDWFISKPYLILILLNACGFLAGIGRILWWNRDEPGTVFLNLIWAAYNLLVLGAAVGVARETRQVRVSHRSPMHLSAVLYRNDGSTLSCQTEDYSDGGLGISLDSTASLHPGEQVHIALHRGGMEFAFSARIAVIRGTHIGLRFENFTLEDEKNLIMCTFARADAWTDRKLTERDRPLHGAREVSLLGLVGYRQLLGQLLSSLSVKFLRFRKFTP